MLSRSGVRLAGLYAALAALALPATVGAQETREHELPDLEEEVGYLDYVKLRLTLANRFVGNADFGAFEATSNQPEGRLRVDFPVTHNLGMRLMGTFRALIYDFDGDHSAFLPGDPFDALLSAGLRLQAAYLFDEDQTLFSDDERWALVVQGGARSAWEQGSRMDDGLRGGGSIAAGYRLGDTLEIAAGVSVGSRVLRSGVAVGPLIEFDWRINEDWKLKSYGLGLQVERRLGEQLVVFARARSEGSSYRLADRDGALGKGALSVRQVPAALGLRWRPLDFLSIQIQLGAIAYNKMKLRNSNDDTVGSVTASGPSPYATLRFDVRH
jgi:hypothetical protein